MVREAVAVDFAGLRGGMHAEHGTDISRGGGINISRLVRPVPGVPAEVHRLASGVQAMSTPSSVPEGFRNWLNRLETGTPDRSKLRIGRLGSEENYGTTSADDSRNITEDHSDDHTAVTNTEVASTQLPLVGESLLRHSVEEPRNIAAAHSFARSHSDIGKHAGTGQLTVFYAGMVNVYDEVPFDKAQAIMVLAGRARTWASSNESNVLSECGVPSSIAKSQPVSRAGSPSPQLPTKPECVVPNVKRPKTIATRVELPQARKASLARFLERRKDRLRAGPYTSTTTTTTTTTATTATHDVTMTMRSNRAAPNSSWQSMSQNSSAMSSPSRSNGE